MGHTRVLRDTAVVAATVTMTLALGIDGAHAASPAGDAAHRATVTSAAAVATSVRGLWHFDEKSGTVAHDSSGHGHDGTIFSPTTLGQPGFLGTSFGFGPDRARVEVKSAADLNPGSADFAFTAHVNLTSAPGRNQTYDVVRKGLSFTSTGEFKLEIIPGGRAQCEAKDSARRIGIVKGPSINLADGKWHTVGCRLVGSTWSVIVDSRVISKAVPFGTITNSKSISIGGKYGDEDGVQGRVDEVSLSIG
jgi:hypothetical protein